MNILVIVTLVLGVIIGAGFASGQEIKFFFTNYGATGLVGMILAVLIICIVINLVLRIILKYKLNSYNDFLERIFCKRKVLIYSTRNIIYFFLLASFLIMSIGFSTCLEQQFGINRYVGAVILSILCYIAFIGNIERILQINKYIMPILVLLIIIVGIDTFKNESIAITGVSNNYLFFINSFVYASYNIIPLIPLLATLRSKIVSIKQINIITIITFIVICISAISIYAITLNQNIIGAEILLVEATKQWGLIGNVTFSLVILLAIYTSAICSGYGFANNISKTTKGYRTTILMLCLLPVIVANLSFSTSIQIIYPLFGLLGLAQIFCIIYVAIKIKK